MSLIQRQTVVYNRLHFKCAVTDSNIPRWLFVKYLVSLMYSPCRIRSDRQTTSLTLTTGVCKAGTKMRGASNMNIHYDVIGLLTAVWRSDSGQIVWAA